MIASGLKLMNKSMKTPKMKLKIEIISLEKV
jgi:hypothetical protein